jgi:hypothetical protein
MYWCLHFERQLRLKFYIIMTPKLNKDTSKIKLTTSIVWDNLRKYCETAQHSIDVESWLLHSKKTWMK